jgi:hypothetical protein
LLRLQCGNRAKITAQRITIVFHEKTYCSHQSRFVHRLVNDPFAQQTLPQLQTHHGHHTVRITDNLKQWDKRRRARRTNDASTETFPIHSISTSPPSSSQGTLLISSTHLLTQPQHPSSHQPQPYPPVPSPPAAPPQGHSGSDHPPTSQPE